ncbi:MAG: MerR family transcriptional regulator [Acidobacteriota bacterium]
MTWLKVGELAQRAGLTVRTLHHYDEIGLLRPSRRSAAGYRLYGQDDIARLQQIRSLQQMGWSLDKVHQMLAQPDSAVLETVEQHLGRLRQQLALQRTLIERLERVAEHLRATGSAAVDDFLNTLEAMSMIEKYYTPQQQDWLKQRADAVGEDRIRQVEDEWREVFAGFEKAMQQGTDPASEPALGLARKAQALIDEFTGGNPGIRRSLDNLYRQEGASNVLGRHGFEMAPGVGEYMSRAMAALAAEPAGESNHKPS